MESSMSQRSANDAFIMHRCEQRCVETCNNMGHVQRRNALKVGNPIGRQAEKLDGEARRMERQENLTGMEKLRRQMATRERRAMAAEDLRRLRRRGGGCLTTTLSNGTP